MEHWRLRAVAAAMILGLGLNYLGIRKEARHNVEEVGPLSDQQTRTSFFFPSTMCLATRLIGGLRVSMNSSSRCFLLMAQAGELLIAAFVPLTSVL